jgi:uncharacterized membrane protein (DUF4010 family)
MPTDTELVVASVSGLASFASVRRALRVDAHRNDLSCECAAIAGDAAVAECVVGDVGAALRIAISYAIDL